MDPRRIARVLELNRRVQLADGAERLAGYGLMGLSFASGHVLAFRRFTASTIGPPYTAIWHRLPDGRWSFYTNVEPLRSCPRYFGPALHAAFVDDVEIRWTGPNALSVSAYRARLHLALRMQATPLTDALGLVFRLLPTAVLAHEQRRSVVGPAAGRLLGAGRLELAGRTPSGHSYLMHPRWVWRVAGAAAVLDGADLGPAGGAANQPAVGALLLPARGLFAAGTVAFTPPATRADGPAGRTVTVGLAPAARVFPS